MRKVAVADIIVLANVNLWALLLSAVAVLAVFRFKVAIIPVLAGSSAAGLLLYLAGVVG